MNTNPDAGQGAHTVIYYEVDEAGIVERAWLEFTGEGFLSLSTLLE